MEEKMRVAYSGAEGAFAWAAAKRLFPNAEMRACPDFTAAYSAVETGECARAVLPIENSFAGDVGQVMDLLFFGSLFVCGVCDLPVRHDLLSVRGAVLEDIKTVVSHPQALWQCASFIRSHGFIAREEVNTALAARMVAECGDKSVAALASAEAASLYGLDTLACSVQDSEDNVTRFAVLKREEESDRAHCGQFILMLTTKNEAGALARVLQELGNGGFNLRAIKSRPTKALKWEYYFYLEGEGDIFSAGGQETLARLSELCMSVRLAGSIRSEILL
ncbi:MAG: prephenate dehydratase domain-containing protein [Eubacteriales bacterium]|nr:prephenate dehydratase domain-containing protein [Eubacteriales bacterium]MDD3882842.1 prephenate dehydratase domain-containing protein [Eubacteriales bacterium]MDD4512122.1 prephenate dehydratase domain-containing protein [Eubacteriales bacterium]